MHGAVSIVGKEIRILPEAHVGHKLRRLWALTEGSGEIKRRLNHETASDVLWVLDRWAMTIPPLDLKALMRMAGEAEEQQRTFDAIVSGKRPPVKLDLALPLRPYQATAVALALASPGFLVCDEMGLGKTAVGIGTLVGAGKGPALVVCPTLLQRQWRDKIHEFAPRASVHIARTVSSGYAITPRQCTRGAGAVTAMPGGFPDVLIMNYEKLHGWADRLAGLIRVFIGDEIQACRHSENRKWPAAVQIAEAAAVRLGLSATPIHNYGGEVWNVMEVLRPGMLGTFEEFCAEWCRYDGKHWILKDPAAFGRYLRKSGAMIARTKAEVGRELPALQRCFQTIEGDADVFRKVDSAVVQMAQILLSRASKPMDKMRAAGDLDWRLRQATGIAKAPEVAAFVDLLLETRPKVILCGWHHAVVDIWRETLARHKPVCITGRQSATQKEAAKLAFTKGDSRVLILGLREGAGLDGLQYGCSDIVFGELSWTPAEHEQCEGRPLRDGQRESVTSWYLVTEHGADPVMLDVLGIKAGQISGLRSPDAPVTVARVDPQRLVKLAEEVLRRTQRG